MKKAAVTFVVLGILTGCSTPASEPASFPSTTERASSTEQLATTTSISENKAYEVSYTPTAIAAPLTEINDIETFIQLESQKLEEATIVVYEKKDVEQMWYAALQTKEGSYEIGQIGYEGAGDYSITAIEAFGQTYIKVTGSVGSNSPISDYVSLTTSPPTLLHIEANTIEADLDQDGLKEIVATVGTAAETTVFKMENNSLLSANLNEIMNANIVMYDTLSHTFQAEVTQGQLSTWKIDRNQLRLVK